jgi:hypothetical protein
VDQSWYDEVGAERKELIWWWKRVIEVRKVAKAQSSDLYPFREKPTGHHCGLALRKAQLGDVRMRCSEIEDCLMLG